MFRFSIVPATRAAHDDRTPLRTVDAPRPTAIAEDGEGVRPMRMGELDCDDGIDGEAKSVARGAVKLGYGVRRDGYDDGIGVSVSMFVAYCCPCCVADGVSNIAAIVADGAHGLSSMRIIMTPLPELMPRGVRGENMCGDDNMYDASFIIDDGVGVGRRLYECCWCCNICICICCICRTEVAAGAIGVECECNIDVLMRRSNDGVAYGVLIG